ncbi:MORN repeat-containing protein 1-like [Anguilla rostrata]|uniref:MORN repeat-containing protein 1-like n=1 Tax=Anguilla rostrata TaxID=7938 RepID=UPI0030CE221A
MAAKHQRISQHYSGQVKNLARDGFGVYVYPNGFFRYEGEWKMGKKHGHGKLFMKDGSFYEGEFANGEIEGNGLRYWAHSGNSYSGQFKSGELHGCGVMQYSSGEKYEGEYCYGLREGHGLLLDKEGHTYEGSFHENKKHGEGIMDFRNGDQYEGDWLLDQRQGHGIMRFEDGSVYEGQWRNNLFNGQGTMIHCSGVAWEGLWINGRPSGGASKIVIEGGDVLEVFQGSPFAVDVHLQTDAGDVATGENGRVLQICVGVKFTGYRPTSSSSNLLKLIEDMEEKPIPTPFGFEFISYPLMERGFESGDSRGAPPPSAAKSGFAQTDSPAPEGEWESGSGSHGLGLGGGTPSYLDGKTGCGDQSENGGSTSIIESFSETGNLALPEEESHSANQRVEAGQAKFQNLMLAPPPPDYKPYLVMDELEKQKAAKKPVGKGPSEKLPLSQEKSSDSKSSVGSRVGTTVKKEAADSRSVRPGEYVIMVKDVTNPPFLGHTLPPAFALLRVVPARLKRRGSRAEIPRVKS